MFIWTLGYTTKLIVLVYNMKNIIRKILLEEVKKTEWEYQVRDIGGSDVYYKRKKDEKIWSFIDEKEFEKDSEKGKIVKWNKKK